MNKDTNSTFPIAELTLGAEFNECSIAAAELNKAVLGFFDASSREQRELYELTPEGGCMGQFQVAWASGALTTDDGREIHLALTRSIGSSPESTLITKLVAVTRQNIALPLASFARRPGSMYCDYVQIGPSMYEDMVVTPTDEPERFARIESMRTLFKSDPKSFIGPVSDRIDGLLVTATQSVSVNRIVEQIATTEKPSIAYRTYSKDSIGLTALMHHAIECGVVYFNRLDRDGGKYDWELPGGRKHRIHSSSHHVNTKCKVLYDKYYEKYVSFLEDANFEEMLSCRLPGLKSNIGTQLLALVVAAKLDYYPTAKEIKTNAHEVTLLLDVDPQFKNHLGECDTDHEALLKRVSEFTGRVVIESEVQTWHGRSFATTDIRVVVDEDPDVYTFSYYVRPDAMDDREFALAGVYNVQRRAPLIENPSVVSELLQIVNSADIQIEDF